jgi:hypothetical protein
MLVSGFILGMENYFFKVLFVLQMLTMVLPFIDEIFKIINYHNKYLRFISHFYWMNIALLIGLFKYIKGVETNIWKPTERFQ